MERLLQARHRGTFSLEDFVGTHVLEGFETVSLPFERPSGPYMVHVLALDGVQYGFRGRRALEKIFLLEPPQFIEPTMAHVVEIRNRLDVMEAEIRGKPQTFAAEMLYVTSEIHDGRVIIELGDRITVNPHGVEMIAEWHREGIVPPYLEGRDPDEVEPVAIGSREKPYHPKFASQRGAGKQRRG